MKRLIEAGLTERQAEAIVNEQVQLLVDHLATKADLRTLATELAHKIDLIQSDSQARDQALRAAILQAVDSRISRLAGLMIALVAALAAVIKIF